MAGPSPSARPAAWIAASYVLVAGAWIAWSDRALFFFARSPDVVERLSIAKGWFFVLTTGAGLWVALRHQLERLAGAERQVRDANERLSRANAQLRAVAARVQQVREEEKARIARDLHDDLGQLLTAVSMELDWLEGRLEAMPTGPETSGLVDRAVAASELARETIAVVQRIATDLRPATLDRLGLGDALREEARRFARRGSVACEVEVADAMPALPTGKATALYRIAQEALTNVARHAQAHRVSLRLAADGGVATLTVEDDGVGLDPASEDGPGAVGLASMRERAAIEGGEVRFERPATGGTRVTARIPLDPPRGFAA